MNGTCVTRVYYVVRLPSRQIVAVCTSLGEAAAWVETYNRLMSETGLRVAIDDTRRARSAA